MANERKGIFLNVILFLSCRPVMKEWENHGLPVSGKVQSVAQTDIKGLRQKEGFLKIDSSAVGMQSARTYQEMTQKTSRLSVVRLKGKDNGAMGELFGNLLGTDKEEETEESNQNQLKLEDLTTHFSNLSLVNRRNEQREQREAIRTIKQQCVQFMLELFCRFRGERVSERDFGTSQVNEVMMEPRPLQPVYKLSTLTNEYYHKEEECTSFATTGLVKTADGREITFQLEVGMSRSFEERYSESFTSKSVSYCDPLVINLDTNIASVSDQKFFFDLDADGKEEEISELNAGSGFLALDLNGDGAINDGSELFGTGSGDGFKDLAKYDLDGNGWIDENDEIFQKLLIWTKDEEGKDKLYHLADLGVGAIGLQHAQTQFSLNSSVDNQNNAMIRSTGVFLYENGTVSTIQHLDLAR